ncbi:MAG TPA: PIN domain-containing protein [Pusillimonas sp.]|uniref:PIN domain-containing protein n=1 Tax=Pusillimonas sp. TaxID=3040095 RepID=UPI002B8892CB|nr:PIN domain-containing protein [Pusillimonas sp.]HUH88721.1 PIN domain-containing protein [Pusillimonas sp.]
MNPVPQFVVLDTCVLISNVLRGVLLRLAEQACFQPAWSEIIGDEWRRNAARIWDVPSESVAQQWEELQALFPAADQGEVALFKEGLVHSDPKDWHVIAVARAVLAKQPEASVAVVTRNLRDFRRSELRSLGIGLLDPDQLMVGCWGAYRELLLSSLEQVPLELVAAGRPLEPLSVILKRERLFRLNKLCEAAD